MSAESKANILDRLNKSGRFFKPGEFNRPVPVDAKVGGPPVPGAYDPGVRAGDRPANYDPKNPKLVIQNVSSVELRQILGNSPTFALYDIRELIDEILGTRPDAKR